MQKEISIYGHTVSATTVAFRDEAMRDHLRWMNSDVRQAMLVREEREKLRRAQEQQQ